MFTNLWLFPTWQSLTTLRYKINFPRRQRRAIIVDLTTSGKFSGRRGQGGTSTTGIGRVRHGGLQPRSKAIPPGEVVGRHVVVMAGDPYDELGQMGTVVSRTAATVTILYRNDRRGGPYTKRKKASSLLWLEEGLELFQSTKGTVTVRTKTK